MNHFLPVLLTCNLMKIAVLLQDFVASDKIHPKFLLVVAWQWPKDGKQRLRWVPFYKGSTKLLLPYRTNHNQ